MNFSLKEMIYIVNFVLKQTVKIYYSYFFLALKPLKSTAEYVRQRMIHNQPFLNTMNIYYNN